MIRSGRIINNVSRLTIAVAASQVFMSAAAGAQQVDVHTYHIVSGPLDRTLVQIAQTANVRLSYDSSLVQSVQSAPVEGNYSGEAAIQQALKGTGLELVPTTGGGMTIQKAKRSSQPAAAAATAPSAAVVGASGATANASGTNTSLPLISVAADRDSGGTGFVAESSSTLSRSDVPLSDTPKSVSVVNAAVIQSQNAQNLTDVLRNVSGVVEHQGPFGTPTYSVRGYVPSGSLGNTGITSDGSPVASSFASLTPTIAISSVEVLKGPSAIVNGNNPPGGVINLVKKKPQADPFHEVQISYGSYGDTQLAFDSTGALTSDQKLRYRFIVSGERAGQNSMGYDGQRNLYVAPTVEWKDRNTDITVGYERTVTRQPFPQFTVVYEGGDIVRRYFDHPIGSAQDHFSAQSDNVFLNFERKLTDDLTFVSKESYNKSRQVLQGWAPLLAISATGETPFMASNSLQYYYSQSYSNYLRYKINFGELKNTLVAGWDYSRTHYTQADGTNSGNIIVGSVFNPPAFPYIGDAAFVPSYGLSFAQNSYYVQEQIGFRNLNILASVRRDTFVEGGGGGAAGVTQYAYSPSIGVLYRLTPDIAVYANYNRGFSPGLNLVYGGGLLPPQTSEQEEVGAKFDFLDDKVSVTTAAFRISYTNFAASDPLHRGFSVPVGGAVSRGFEVNVTGQVLPNVNVIANYSYNDFQQPAKATRKIGLPKNTASIWATYNFQTPVLQGLGAGIGLFFAGDQFVGGNALYRMPSQVETDLGLFYRKKGYGLNLSVKNVFNRLLYQSTNSTNSPSFVPMGPVRTIMLTGTYDF